jgi:hypothetical protein
MYLGRSCGTRGREEKNVQGFGEKSGRKKTTGKTEASVEDRIRMDLTETGWRGVELIQLAQDRGRWQALVNTVMNLWVLAPRI